MSHPGTPPIASGRAPLGVRIVTAPDASCGGTTWTEAVGMIRGRLTSRLGEAVTIEHVAVFSPRFFEMPGVVAAIEAGAELPLVEIGDVIVSQDGKLSEPRIAEALRALGVGETQANKPS